MEHMSAAMVTASTAGAIAQLEANRAASNKQNNSVAGIRIQQHLQATIFHPKGYSTAIAH